MALAASSPGLLEGICFDPGAEGGEDGGSLRMMLCEDQVGLGILSLFHYKAPLHLTNRSSPGRLPVLPQPSWRRVAAGLASLQLPGNITLEDVQAMATICPDVLSLHTHHRWVCALCRGWLRERAGWLQPPRILLQHHHPPAHSLLCSLRQAERSGSGGRLERDAWQRGAHRHAGEPGRRPPGRGSVWRGGGFHSKPHAGMWMLQKTRDG